MASVAPAMTNRPAVEYRPVTAAMLAEHARLSAAEYRDSPICQVAHLEWKYCQNPAGAAHVYELRSGEGELIGRVFLQPVRFRDGSRELRAANLVDLLIHPQHRGMASFVALMRAVSSTPGFDFLYLTPNAQSMPLYRQVLRYPEVSRLQAAGIVLRADGVLQKLAGRLARLRGLPNVIAAVLLRAGSAAAAIGSSMQTVANEPPSRAEFEALVARMPGDGVLAGARSFDLFEWRFIKSPIIRYDLLVFRRDRVMTGYAVLRHTVYESLPTTFVVDFALDPALSSWQRAQARWQIVTSAVAAKSEIVFSLASRPADSRLFPVGPPLFPIPAALLPQQTPLFCVDLTPGIPKRLDAHSLLVSPANLDVF
jgi:hypothetical protein